MSIWVDKENRVVIGELRSTAYLSKEIAEKMKNNLMFMRLKASYRYSKNGWLATIEDYSGAILLYKTDIPSSDLAEEIAKKSLKEIE